MISSLRLEVGGWRLLHTDGKINWRIVVSWKKLNLVSVAGDIQHGVDPGPDLGRGAERGLCHLLVPGTVHAGLVEELLLLQLPLSDGLEGNDGALLYPVV